jgi:hypothetical protein
MVSFPLKPWLRWVSAACMPANVESSHRAVLRFFFSECTLHPDIIEIVTEGRLRSEAGVVITMDAVFNIVRSLSEGLAEASADLLIADTCCVVAQQSVQLYRPWHRCQLVCVEQKLSFSALQLTIEEGRVDLFPMV